MRSSIETEGGTVSRKILDNGVRFQTLKDAGGIASGFVLQILTSETGKQLSKKAHETAVRVVTLSQQPYNASTTQNHPVVATAQSAKENAYGQTRFYQLPQAIDIETAQRMMGLDRRQVADCHELGGRTDVGWAVATIALANIDAERAANALQTS